MGNFIYRYKYLSDSAWLRKTIAERTIKFTNPQKFNDPFDCMPAFDVKYTRDMSRLLPGIREIFKLDDLSFAEREKQLSIIESHMGEEVRSGRYLSGLLSSASVLSLSKIPDSTLMWSHYAKNHSGVVLEFKIDVGDRSATFDNAYSKFICQDVFYSDVRPLILMDGSPANPTTIVKEMFLTKSQVWSYEKESRVIKNDGGEGVFKYDDSLLSSVIFGARNTSKCELLELVATTGRSLGRDIPVFEAKFCGRNYKLDIPKFSFKKEDGVIQSDYPSDR
ncbi:DUF2971 domain-containing protein [Pseudomonas reactans]